MGDFKKSNRMNDNRTTELPNEQLSEEDIGITQYISDHEGFHGIVKYRFSDFQVSEINLKGEVAKLTDTSAPSLPKPEEITEDEDLLFNKYNVEILPMDVWDKINKMVVDNNHSDVVQIDVTDKTKEDRTAIHNAVKNAFGSAIVGSTVTQHDKKFVQFKVYKRGDRIDKRVKWPWPGEYVYFIVHKTNCDSMEAASRIAESMRSHIRAQMISFAGTKDRRAVTSQWFCVRKVEPHKLVQAARQLTNITLGNFSFHHEVLKLGMLQGNLFRVAIRNITASEELISKACTSLKEKGFINYYGQQRFGSRKSVPTWLVGKHLLKGDIERAIECVLSSQDEAGAEGRGRGGWRGGRRGGRGGRGVAPPSKWDKYYNRFPSHSPEGRMLAAITTRPGDLYGAFNSIPRNLRLLYINSYQSVVWNRCVSERLARHGLQPAPGDLVLAHPHTLTDETLDESSDTETEDGSTNKQTDDKDKKPSKNETNGKHIEVSELSEDDIASGRYSIADVVLPLPGYRVHYPRNMLDYYTRLLEADGLTLKLNKNKHQRSYTLSGTYRHIVRLPVDVSWRCVSYSDPKGTLIPSDLDLLHNVTPDGLDQAGKYRALLVSFSLPASSYATMLLRELLKADTSSHAQALNNHYYKEPTLNTINKETTQHTSNKETTQNTSNKEITQNTSEDTTQNTKESTQDSDKETNKDTSSKETEENTNKRTNESDKESVKKIKVD